MTETRVEAQRWRELAGRMHGTLHVDRTTRMLYATDASIYQELPIAVAYPHDESDLALLIAFARENKVGLIPRTAGTSLAGQVVGSGLVVDVSRHFTRIIEIDPARRRARVQPGVVRNELNLALRPHGLFFAPETSTANRAMIGGMVGNNSCGSNSIVYGSTRDHVLEMRGFLSDGTIATFGPLSSEAFAVKGNGSADALETRLYREIWEMLGDSARRDLIRRAAPRREVTRRNTGYALEALLDAAPFSDAASARPFNFCKLLAGSEGTLFFATEITVNCEPLPPPASALVIVHCQSIDEALQANLIALRHRPHASELIDDKILECTKANIEQRRNRFFIQGDPGAILVVELRSEKDEAVAASIAALESDLRSAKLGYAYPVIRGTDQNRVWDMRRAGLGLLSNIPGDAKPVAVVEDTAVAVDDLAAYIRDFDQMLARQGGLKSVHYAHAGAGEIHLRPVLNLKDAEDVRRLRAVAEETAALVRRYRGSLSGEHGDGRLRAEFLRKMVGDEVYAMFVQLKRTWDPLGIFNPGKIVDAPPMDTHLRYAAGQQSSHVETIFNFGERGGFLRAAEMCNGSGDCRKTHLAGGTMCPSYMATRNEKDTTRARANMLRHVLTSRISLDDEGLHQVMDLCLSCKGCKSECPSNVDMARLKAEVTQARYDVLGTPWRARLVASMPRLLRAAAILPALSRVMMRDPMARLIKRIAGFHPNRSLPEIRGSTLRRWFARRSASPRVRVRGRVMLLADEFTNVLDSTIGIAAVELLELLGYSVELAPVTDSGRAAMSKGLLRQAAGLAARNVKALRDRVNADCALIGIEPSALFSFRDEYPDLLRGAEAQIARELAPHCLMIDEFLVREAAAGRITRNDFHPADPPRTIHLHGHCHQKALTTVEPTVKMLELIEGYRVRPIPSGCCGMAGSFGYERDHYDLSMQIGELVLFPAVRALADQDIVAAPGTSCRHQIRDGTGRSALHPVELMRRAVRSPDGLQKREA